MSHQPLVSITGLSKAYREGGVDRDVFRDLALELSPGERLALLGRSGTGKSTLLNLISGIDLPDAGRVVIAGHDITALSEHERTLFRRRHIGFVFQFYNLIPTLTVGENLLLPIELTGRIDARARNRARILLEQIGLAERAGSYPDRLSGGEQQRVAVARAIMHRPLLLLADEPTGNLDEESSARVLGLLHDLVREADSALLMLTHSAGIARCCDRVMALSEGSLRLHSPIQEIG